MAHLLSILLQFIYKVKVSGWSASNLLYTCLISLYCPHHQRVYQTHKGKVIVLVWVFNCKRSDYSKGVSSALTFFFELLPASSFFLFFFPTHSVALSHMCFLTNPRAVRACSSEDHWVCLTGCAWIS